jgi:hypothetical protein
MSTATAVDSCHCCEPTDASDGAPINAPGLSSLNYRIGSYGTFLNQMIRRLPLLDLASLDPTLHGRVLARLTTRDLSDPTLALIDAWASALDILTFYQERIANENYLRSATERRSVLELARAVGYELAPGLAASVDLVFTAETVVGQPHEATIDIGTKVMSVPGQGEGPQIFETIESLEVRGDWNQLMALPPTALAQPPVPETIANRPAVPQPAGTPPLYDLYVDGSTPVVVGDALLINPAVGAAPSLKFVVRIEPAPGTSSVRVFVDQPLAPPGNQPVEQNCFVLRQRAAMFGHNAPDWRTLSDQVRLNYPPAQPATNPDPPNFTPSYPLQLDTYNPRILVDSWIVLQRMDAASSPPTHPALFKVAVATAGTRADFALSTRVTSITFAGGQGSYPGSFGIRNTAVLAQSELLKLGQRPATPPSTIPDRQFPSPSADVPPNPASADRTRRSLPLRAPPPSVAILEPGRRITVVGKRIRLRAQGVDPVDPAGRFKSGDEFILLERVHILPVQNDDGSSTNKFRWLLQRLSGEQLEFLGDDLSTPFNLVSNDAAHPNGSVLPAGGDDPVVGETLTLESVVASAASTPDTLVFTTLPSLVYDRATVIAFANVVRATHGETIANEVLGSGSSTPNLSFPIKRKPLTYLASASPTGITSTLVVRVNEVEWHEVPSLFGLGPRQRNFTVRTDDDGQATVILGDGVSGARPPTGAENIVASYRTGLGPEGMVRANALSLLLTRIIGVRSVTNPLPAFNGVGPASLAQARTNTPLNVRATGRVVSVLDAEDFARTFAGIGNAQAVLIGIGNSRVVHLTVAGADGTPIPAGSPLLDTLRRAVEAAADPSLRVMIDTFEELPFVLEGTVVVNPDFLPDRVLAAAKDTLTSAFGVTARPFGGLVTEAEILSLVHGVPGVIAAAVTAFRKESDATNVRLTSLRVASAHLSAGGTGAIVRAQVAVLGLGNPILTAVAP